MEFLSGPDGPIVRDADKALNAEHLARTQAAMEIFQASAERILYFKQRAENTDRSGRDVVITLIDADDPIGRVLADALMPNYDWQPYRDAGQVPVARGLAPKAGVAAFLQQAGYAVAAAELTDTEDLRVLVMHAEVAVVVDPDYEIEG